MLGHKTRFNFQFIDKIQKNSNKKIENMSYTELYLSINNTETSSEDEETEKLYLLSKLAIILTKNEFFDFNNLNENLEGSFNAGYLIWKAFSLIFKNELDKSSKLLNLVQRKLDSKDILLFADYFLTRLFLLVMEGKYNEAINKFLENKEIIDKLPLKASFTKLGIYYYISYTYNVLKNSEKAIKLINEVTSTNIEKLDKFYLAKLNALVGSIFLQKGENDKAREIFIKSLNISREINDHYGTISRLLGLGSLEYRISNYEESIKYLTEAKEKAIKYKMTTNIPICHNRLSNVYSMQGRLNEAKIELEIALKIYLDSNNFRSASTIYNGLGMIFSDQGIFEKAEENFLKAIELSEKFELKYKLEYIYNNLGLLYRNNGDFIKAKHIYEKIQLEKVEDISILSKIVLNLVDTYRLLGDFQNSLNVLKKAIILVEKVNNPELQAMLLDRSARINYEQGNIPLAKSEIIKALKIFETLNNPIDISNTKQLIGRIELVQNNVNAALEVMIEAYNKLHQKKLFGIVYQSLVVCIADIFVNLGRFDESRHWLQKLSISDETVTIFEEIKAQRQMINIYERFTQNFVLIEELEKFENILVKKKYFNINLKLKLLKIRLYIQKNETGKALNLISDGLKIASDKKLVILEIEMNLLKSLILARKFKYDKAIENCQIMNQILVTNNLDYYINKQQETIELINNSRASLESLYDMAEDENKEKAADSNKNISLDTILQYIDSTVRTIQVESAE